MAPSVFFLFCKLDLRSEFQTFRAFPSVVTFSYSCVSQKGRKGWCCIAGVQGKQTGQPASVWSQPTQSTSVWWCSRIYFPGGEKLRMACFPLLYFAFTLLLGGDCSDSGRGRWVSPPSLRLHRSEYSHRLRDRTVHSCQSAPGVEYS